MSRAEMGWVQADGQISSGLTDSIFNDLIIPTMKHLGEVIRDDPLVKEEDRADANGATLARAMTFRHWIPMAAQYELNGRQIFDFTEELTTMLDGADLGECTLEDWNAPYNAFYLHFGKRETMSSHFSDDETGAVREYVDGAYVAVTPFTDGGSDRRIKFGLTTVKDDGSPVMLPGHFMDLIPEEQKLPFPAAIEHAIARKMADFADNPNESDGTRALDAHRREILQDAAGLLTAASTLIVNALFYIETVGDTSDPQPGRDAPPSLTAEWFQKPAKRRKLAQKLTRDGYAIVHLVGNEVTQAMNQNVLTGTKKAHWRRGHRRDQPYGPQLSKVKRIFIKPTMIHRDQMGPDTPGHIYVAGSDRPQ
jgi:hypothetical protein